MRGWWTRHPVVSFYLLAYLYSWVIAVPLALQARGLIDTRVPFWLHYLTAYGPMLAALTLTRRWRCTTTTAGWTTFAAVAPLAFFAAGGIMATAAGQAYPRWIELGRVNFLPALGWWSWLLWFATSGIGEEFGWRGFALPRLQQTQSAFRSTVLLGLAWAGWHLPAFFYLPGYTEIGVAVTPAVVFGLLCGAVVLTWLYNSSGGSVVAAALWHASFNFVTASPSAAGLPAAAVSTLVMIWAIAIVLFCDHNTLAMRSVRATAAERGGTLPGDDRISSPLGSLTHAITIRATKRQIWPWLAQMGAGRAGWYSYDLLDNGGRRSATYIDPSLQHLNLGMLFPALPRVTEGFVLVDFAREQRLLLGWRGPDSQFVVTWAFILNEIDDTQTRLIARARGSSRYQFHHLPAWIGIPAAKAVHFVMERKQLLEIANRAEGGVVDAAPAGEVAAVNFAEAG